MSNTDSEVTHDVSVKLMAGEEADAIVAAAFVDNADITVEDYGSYITINGNERLEFSIETIVEELGRPYDVPNFLVVLASYTGQVDVADDRVFIKKAMST
ncbi:MAG: MmoB/DmpM family protein [Rhodospirillales bacterium]